MNIKADRRRSSRGGSPSESERQIKLNIAVHDRIARRYEKLHDEIFNDGEQARVAAMLRRARDLVTTGANPLQALDFGCGSGNLTRHLLALGVSVTSADVSRRFLEMIRSRYPAAQTLAMNGRDLSNLADNSFDMVAVYSVLHHIPDYLGAVRELARACKPGGVVFIDHERTDEYWDSDPSYAAFRKLALRFDWRKYMRPSNYWHWLRRRFNPRHANEGDIHVWPEDRIEWAKIAEIMAASGFEVVVSENYLLDRRLYRQEVYDRYAGVCSDTKVMVFRKLASARANLPVDSKSAELRRRSMARSPSTQVT